MKVFISQKMNGLSDAEILNNRWAIMKKFNITHEELIDSYIKTEETNPVKLLAKSLELMADADLVLMPTDFSQSRGCTIEFMTSQKYDIRIICYDLNQILSKEE